MSYCYKLRFSNILSKIKVPSNISMITNYNIYIIFLSNISNIFIISSSSNNNITFILIKAPSLYPYWYEEYNNQIIEFAQKYHIDYYNLKDNIDDIGIDYSIDTYDGGIHLNLTGATKLSNYFGKILVDKYKLTDYRTIKSVNSIYQDKIILYNKAIEME